MVLSEVVTDSVMMNVVVVEVVTDVVVVVGASVRCAGTFQMIDMQ